MLDLGRLFSWKLYNLPFSLQANHLGYLSKCDIFVKPELMDKLPSQISHKITHMLAKLWEQLDGKFVIWLVLCL